MFIQINAGQVVNTDYIRDFAVFNPAEFRITFQDGTHFSYLYSTNEEADMASKNFCDAICSNSKFELVYLGNFTIPG